MQASKNLKQQHQQVSVDDVGIEVLKDGARLSVTQDGHHEVVDTDGNVEIDDVDSDKDSYCEEYDQVDADGAVHHVKKWHHHTEC